MENEGEEASSAARPTPPFDFSNPCSFMLYVLRACAQCLGCQPSPPPPPPPSPSSTGAGDDDNDNGSAATGGDPSIDDGSGVQRSAARQRPRAPPVGEGRGGQIN